MSKAYITNHRFTRHQRAINNMAAAAQKLDRELKELARRTDLYDGERRQREKAIRDEAGATIHAARQAIVKAIEEDKAGARFVDSPTGTELQQRAYWAQAAVQDLAGLTGEAALAVVRQIVESGDHVRGMEYVRAARAVALQSGQAGQLKALELQAETKDQQAHRAFAQAVEAVEAQLPWLDQSVAMLVRDAGQVPYEVKEGLAPEQPMSTRVLSLWLSDAERSASVALERSLAASAGRPVAEWARPHEVDPSQTLGQQDGQAVPEGAPGEVVGAVDGSPGEDAAGSEGGGGEAA